MSFQPIIQFPSITEILKDFHTLNIAETPKIRELQQNLQEAAATLEAGQAQVKEYVTAVKIAYPTMCINCRPRIKQHLCLEQLDKDVAAIKIAYPIMCNNCRPPIELHLCLEQLEDEIHFISAQNRYEYEIYTQLSRK